MNEIKENKNEFDIMQIGNFVNLEKSGSRYKCCCPIHGEKTPSLVLYPETNSWYCFGCNQGGDYIEFIRQLKHFESRSDAYQDITGKKLKSKDILTSIEKEIKLVSKYYQAVLTKSTDGQKALEYIKERGFSENEIEEFEIGYSNGLKGKTLEEIIKKSNELSDDKIKIGLFDFSDSGIFNEKQTCDIFYKRIAFPLYNSHKHLVGFTARTIEENDIKYLNSKEGVFKKNNCFFNYKNALPYIKEKNEVIICEGTFDAMSYYVSGKKNVLATCGCALSKAHLYILKEHASKIILAYDNDKAGINSILKTAKICKEAGFNVETITLKDAKDANEYMQKFGREALLKKASKTNTIYSFIVKMLPKDKQIKKIYNYLNLENVFERNQIIEKVSKYFNIDKTDFTKDYVKTFNLNTIDYFNYILFNLNNHNKKIVLRILDNFITNDERKLLETNSKKDYSYYNAYEIKELCFKFIESKLKDEENELF